MAADVVGGAIVSSSSVKRRFTGCVGWIDVGVVVGFAAAAAAAAWLMAERETKVVGGGGGNGKAGAGGKE